MRGNASCFVLAVGDMSSAAAKLRSIEIEEAQAEDNDLLDKHNSIVTILIVVLLLASILIFVQCGLNIDVPWVDSGNIALMMFVYGFPYILAIPAIWDIALRNTARQLKEGRVVVQSLDTIEEVASLDYLAVQTIGVLEHNDPTKNTD